jgi:hypothetical protein
MYSTIQGVPHKLCQTFECYLMSHSELKVVQCRIIIHYTARSILTIKSWPRCTVRTFNSSHAAGLGAPYVRECI